MALDQQRQRVRRELELAHDLQLCLLPAPALLEAEIDVGAVFAEVDSFCSVRADDQTVVVLKA